MSFRLTVRTNNTAFRDGAGNSEVARILRDAAERIEKGADVGGLLDAKGNTVGEFKFSRPRSIGTKKDPSTARTVENADDGAEISARLARDRCLNFCGLVD